MIMQAQRNKYLETTVQTASPAQLLIMLCDGAIRFCKAGIEAINNRNYEEANRNICKAQDIISEFSITLDRNSPIADGLLKLYDYYLYLLVEGNTKKKTEPVEEVRGYLTELKETWIQAAKLAAQPSASLKHG